MYNDDLTFELILLETFIRCGYEMTANDIAEDWAAYLPFAFTAEGVALRNIKQGIFPPESALFRNPMREMIGAQMRGAICGQIAPGDLRLAAELAWKDGSISHANNGILGEVFNAIMVAHAFVEPDMKTVLRTAIDLMPRDSKFYEVVQFAWEQCEEKGEWYAAWLACDEAYKHYNWIHAYPNACAEVVSLYFCDNDYDRLVSLIATCGLDTDCNAAQVAAVLATSQGMRCISDKWLEPIGDYMETYVRGMERVRFNNLAARTTKEVIKRYEDKR